MAEQERESQKNSLTEFIRQPNTIAFCTINSDIFKDYISDKPYIKLGTKLFRSNYIVAYTNENYMPQILSDLGSDIMRIYPELLSTLDENSNNISEITRIQNQPFLDLRGGGVLVGIIDTGIDYTKDVFIYEDGSSKIQYIWDQTVDSSTAYDVDFGTVYKNSDINQALNSPNPRSLVSTVDSVGHGTFMASVAAGRKVSSYIGSAPDAELIVVKLKGASRYYIDKFGANASSKELYETTDFMLGIHFIMDKAAELKKPVVICISLGSNFGSHDGSTLFESYIYTVSQYPGTVFVMAAGNESNTKHHTHGILPKTGSAEIMSVDVAHNASTFCVNIWCAAWNKISVGVKSPTGEIVERRRFKPGIEYTEKLVFENSVVSISHYYSSSNLVMIVLKNATAGMWNFTIYGEATISGTYHAWLPCTGVSSPGVEFTSPTPNYTIVSPATAIKPITCGAYSANDGSLYVSSSWGPNRLAQPSPDFVAPGVDVMGIYPSGPGSMTGTSVAAAITSGACALILQWGVVQQNEPAMSSERVRSLLISGCKKENGVEYPNNQFGFGKLDLYGAFDNIREN